MHWMSPTCLKSSRSPAATAALTTWMITSTGLDMQDAQERSQRVWLDYRREKVAQRRLDPTVVASEAAAQHRRRTLTSYRTKNAAYMRLYRQRRLHATFS